MKTTKKLFILLLVMVLSFSFYNTEVYAKRTVKINRPKKVLYVGMTTKLKLLYAKGNIEWKSSNKKIATVSKKGNVKAKKKGIVVITAKYKGKKYKCKLTVKAKKSDLSNYYNPSVNREDSEDSEDSNDDGSYITYENYQSITAGMQFQNVIDILGQYTQVHSSYTHTTDEYNEILHLQEKYGTWGDYLYHEQVTYMWKNPNTFNYIYVTFNDNIVLKKEFH